METTELRCMWDLQFCCVRSLVILAEREREPGESLESI